MKVSKNSVVAISYELMVDGGLADKAVAEKPLEYIHGTGMLLPRFEEELEGKEQGDDFAFVLSPEEGYGVHNPEYVFDLPIEAFAIDGEVRRDLLQLGRTIPMLNSAGQVVQGTIREIREEAVTMDFNHPMAGKTLHFTGRVEKRACARLPKRNSPRDFTENTSLRRAATARAAATREKKAAARVTATAKASARAAATAGTS